MVVLTALRKTIYKRFSDILSSTRDSLRRACAGLLPSTKGNVAELEILGCGSFRVSQQTFLGAKALPQRQSWQGDTILERRKIRMEVAHESADIPLFNLPNC